MHRRQACAALPNDENPEQAVQRRLRESEEVAERVKFLQDRVELDAALERVRPDLGAGASASTKHGGHPAEMLTGDAFVVLRLLSVTPF